jgi:acyl-coenzyme A synthetase/AMP-(fatty) acid ligase
MTVFVPCPTPFNLAQYALRHAPRLGEKPALEWHSTTGVTAISFAALESAVRGTATGFLAQGLVPGDRILLRIGNSLGFPVAFLAAIAAGMVPVPTSAALTVAEITRMAEQIKPALIVAEAGIALPAGQTAVITVDDLQSMARLAPCDWAMGDANRLAYIVFTSGTSGNALPVAHAHRAIWARRMMHQGWEGLTDADRLMHAGALNWTYTLGTGLLDPWSVGATALLFAPGTLSDAFAPLLAQAHATIFAAAPGVYRQMLKHPLPPLPGLRHGLSAGEALSADLRNRWFAATGTDLHEALGMTECSTFLSGSPSRPAPAGSSGYAQPGRKVAVLNDDGQISPPGTPGVLAVHHSDPGLMLGYLDNAPLTAARYLGDWFVTGDLVQQDADGSFRHLGRADDVMNPGGFRVSPHEVEAAIAGLAGLTDCAVAEVKLPSGVSVIACGYVAGFPLDDAALLAHAAQSLARYKQPRFWHHLDHLPRNANNKLDRRLLRQILQERTEQETR